MIGEERYEIAARISELERAWQIRMQDREVVLRTRGGERVIGGDYRRLLRSAGLASAAPVKKSNKSSGFIEQPD